MLATVDETHVHRRHDDRRSPTIPIAWCKDYEGGRSFYTDGGATAATSATPQLRKHLGGALQWAAGEADPVYSDCGATVLANYQQTKISAPPNLNEPIGFDELPGRSHHRRPRARGQLRLHDPADGSSTGHRHVPVYTNCEDGLYGPAVDNDFATNKWVYLYYAPPTVARQASATARWSTSRRRRGSAPTVAPTRASGTTVGGLLPALPLQVRRRRRHPTLDLASEQKIMQVANNRGACCHVAGDIDFDNAQQPVARHG